MRRLTSVGLFLTLVAIALAVDPARAEISESRICSARKLTIMGKCYSCLVKEELRALAGKSSSPERCHDRLVEKFASTETDYLCPVNGDAETAYGRVTARYSTLAADLAALSMGAPDPVACTLYQLKAAARHARCSIAERAFSMKAGIFGHRSLISSPYYGEKCAEDLIDRLNRSATEMTCADAYTGAPLTTYGLVSTSVAYFSAYLPGGDFVGAEIGAVGFQFGELSNADFTNASMEYASFNDADLSGAVLSGAELYTVGWDSTICPDGMNSDDVGGTCCGHHVGLPPASCD